MILQYIFNLCSLKISGGSLNPCLISSLFTVSLYLSKLDPALG